MANVATWIGVTNLGSGLDPKFCTVTLVNAVSGHTMSNTSANTLDGMVPESSGLIVNVWFDEKCGWTFDHWTIETTVIRDGAETVTTATSTANYHRLLVTVPAASTGNYSTFLQVAIRAFGTYNGTGKIMRSYVDSSKLLRVGNALVRDA